MVSGTWSFFLFPLFLMRLHNAWVVEANGSFEKWKESSHSLWDQPKGNVLDLAFIQLYPEEYYETLLL